MNTDKQTQIGEGNKALNEQAAILLCFSEHGLLQPEDIIRWADTIIADMEKPPAWILELSVLNSPHFVDLISHLRKHAAESVSLRQAIQIIVLAREAGFFGLIPALSKLFSTVFWDYENSPPSALSERLTDALVYWDCQEDSDEVGPELQAKLDAIFREYLADAEKIAAVLPWKFKKAN